MSTNPAEPSPGYQSTPPSERPGPLDLGQQGTVETMQRDFARRVQEARGQFQQRYAEQYLTYGNAVMAAQRDMQEAYAKATQRYVQDLKDAWGMNDSAAGVTEAYQRFTGLLEELSDGAKAQGTVRQAYSNFIAALESAGSTSAVEDAREAYGAYVRALQRALAQGETQKRAAEAHAEFLLQLRQLRQQQWRRAMDAYSAYQRALADAPSSTDFSKRIDAAMESALTGLQQAWQQMYAQYSEAAAAAMSALRTPPSAGAAS
jgi:hypothetical protein